MRRKALSIAVGLTLVIGLLLVAGAAWAQAEETPITVGFYACQRLEEPEREWVDEDGIEHVRNELFSCRRIGDMVGKDIGWASWERDPAAGDYFEHGYYAFTGRVLGGEVTGGIGRYTVEGNRIEGVWTYTSEDVMHLDGGGLVKLSGAWRGGAPIIYSGVFLDPPGGVSRQGPRPRRK